MWKVYLKTFVAVCALMMTLAVPAAGRKILVPSEFTSIQAAINDANDGDEIEVSPGTYNEAINFNGKAVRLYSSGGRDVTIIDANGIAGAYHVLQCVSGEDANTILEGFTITGGNANGTEPNDRCGGGMFNYNSSPTIINCLFGGNSTGDGSPGTGDGGHGGCGGNGAGMYNLRSSPTVIDCWFSHNRTGKGGHGAKGTSFPDGNGGHGGSGGAGAGMCNVSSAPVVTRCTFIYNVAGDGGNGAYSDWDDGGSGGHGGAGAGMYNNHSSPTVTECTFSDNTTGSGGNGDTGFGQLGDGGAGGRGGDGAGMHNTDGSAPAVRNCTFFLNITGKGGNGGWNGYRYGPWEDARARGGRGGYGAGMFNRDRSSPTVANCRFAYNECGDGGQGGPGNNLYVLGPENLGYGGPGGDGGQGAGMCNTEVSSPIISNCRFIGNKAGHGGRGGDGGSVYGFGLWTAAGNGGHGGPGGSGGGIYSYQQSSPRITKCQLRDNRAGSGGNGGDGGGNYASFLPIPGFAGDGGRGGSGAGVCFDSCYVPDVNECSFFQNQTGCGGIAGRRFYSGLTTRLGRESVNGQDGYGGGIGNSTSSTIVSNSVFSGNITSYGGGMSNEEGSSSVITNCTFIQNLGRISGGGISNHGHSNSIVTNCTFKENAGSISGGAIYNSESYPTVTNCILWGDSPNECGGSTSTVTYCDVKGGHAGSGNIDTNPMFGEDGWRLSLGSLCIDAGSNTGPNLPAKDFDGYPRIVGTRVDMGAFECTDLRIRNVTRDILYGSIQGGIDDSNDGDELCVLPGTYKESIDFKGKAVRLYSTSGQTHTIIDGAGTYHTVQCVNHEGPGTILEGFTITGGNANGSWPNDCGGGMYNERSSPTIIDCLFTGNAAASRGGGMYNHVYNDQVYGHPRLIRCTFSKNIAAVGAGLCNDWHVHPEIVECQFTENTASEHCGGMYNVDSSSPSLTGCFFAQNKAENNGYGGGMLNSTGSSPSLANCMFMSNSAGSGGGMYNYDNSHPVVTNCTFRWNFSTVTGGGMYNYANSNPIVTNCILWDNTPDAICDSESKPVITYSDVQGGYEGEGNIDSDPCFAIGSPIGGQNPEAVYSLASSASPCVDAGTNEAPNLPAEDRRGNPRNFDGNVDGIEVVDMGAYELQPRVRNITRDRWYQFIQSSINDAEEGDEIVVTPGIYYGSVDFHNEPNIILRSTDPEDPDVVKQTIIDAKFGSDTVRFYRQGPSFILAGFTITNSSVEGFSTSWGITSYDGPTSPTISNCIITNTTGLYLEGGSPVISKCTIRDNSRGLFGGGGTGATIVQDCTIISNYDYFSAVMDRGNSTFTRCVISGNHGVTAAISGFDSYGYGYSTIEDCIIRGNTGSGIHYWSGPIKNCSITHNGTVHQFEGGITTQNGGGIDHSTGPITNCLIRGNKALDGGGLAMCSGAVTNCVIEGNSADRGGGMAFCDGEIVNCTILGNRAFGIGSPEWLRGGGLYECTGPITNCIIRQNWAQTEGDQLYSCSEPTYSCIQDWSGGGVGNIAADPCFVYPGYWADANDPNIVVEPNDPNAVWVNGNYHLRRGSPCIDAGDNDSVPADISDHDGDGDVNEPVPFDLGGLPRFIEDLCAVDSGNPGTVGAPVVDMGAYEFLPADIDSSGAVNLRDLSMLALYWGETACGLCGGANLNCDGKIDFNDLLLLTDWWLAGVESE